MWMLSFIPDSFLIWVINIVILAGLGGIVVTTLFKFFIKFMPWLIPYRTLAQVVSLVLLISGIYLRGGYDTEMNWRAKVEEAEAKVAIAEAKSKETNTQIKTVYVDRIKVVKDTKVVIQERIKNIEVKIDSQCRVVPEAIDVLNDAARKPGVKK
jgi:hypothetical protein